MPGRVNRRRETGRRRVALLIESSNAYGRGLLAGIHDYKSVAEHWITSIPEHGRGVPPLDMLRAWRGDGIIARLENRRIAQVVGRLGVPTIDTSAARLIPSLPYVETDDAAIARLASEHLRGIGFHHFAFCGERRFQWSENRLQHFEKDLGSHGCALDAFSLPARPWKVGDDDERLGRWLAALPKPVGIFACYDILGRRILEVCNARSIQVPDEVAVLGVDDDELLCRLATPPLSSVIPDARGAGRLAAELLDQMLDGGTVAVEHLLPPRGVAVRQSTDVLSIEDPLVAASARFIRDNISRGVKVEEVASVAGVSRRVLEQRFVKALQRTPHDEIARVQFRLVEDLLENTELKISAIANRCGFRHPEYLTAAFTKRHGVAPGEWRRGRRR